MKADTPASEVDSVKQSIKDQGGKITHEYTLINGFAYVFPWGCFSYQSLIFWVYFSAELPDDHISTLDSHPQVERVERDQVMTTQ